MKCFRLFRGQAPALGLLLSLAALLPIAAAAQDAAATLHLRTLASSCASCHGSNGKAVDGSTVPSLAGIPRETMIASMTGFKNGSRPATVMHQLAKGFTDDQIGALATYFAAVR